MLALRDARRTAPRSPPPGLPCSLLALLLLALAPAADAESLAEQVEAALTRGVAYLGQAQWPSGEFPMWACADQALSLECQPDTSTLATGFILHALTFVPEAAQTSVIANSVQFLRSEMDEQGFFRYHQKQHPLHAQQPPSLEDTVCNLIALEAAGQPAPDLTAPLRAYQMIDGAFPLHAVPLQTISAVRANPRAAAEYAPGLHPIFLSLLGARSPVANAHILAYYAGRGAVPDALCRYVLNAGQGSPGPDVLNFYDGPYPFMYAAARAHAQGAACLTPLMKTFRQRLLEEQGQDGLWGPQAVQTAWAANALLWIGRDGTAQRQALDRAAGALVATQREDGSWPRAVIWHLQEPPLWFGSEEATTGLVLEFLGRYRQRGA